MKLFKIPCPRSEIREIVLRSVFYSNFHGSGTKVTLNNMTYTEEYIRNKLTNALDACHVEVVDESDGCGAKFSCVVVSGKFQGKNILQRHRLVNSALSEELKTIHAFSQKTFTPDQWEKLKEESQ